MEYAGEPLKKLKTEKMTRTELILFLASYLTPRDLGKMVKFYDEGMKRINGYAKKQAFEEEQKKKLKKKLNENIGVEKEESSVCLKADKNIGICQVSLSWLKAELQRQLRLGSYEVVEKTDTEAVATIVIGEKRMLAGLTEREDAVLKKFYKPSNAADHKLGLLRIQVGGWVDVG